MESWVAAGPAEPRATGGRGPMLRLRMVWVTREPCRLPCSWEHPVGAWHLGSGGGAPCRATSSTAPGHCQGSCCSIRGLWLHPAWLHWMPPTQVLNGGWLPSTARASGKCRACTLQFLACRKGWLTHTQPQHASPLQPLGTLPGCWSTSSGLFFTSILNLEARAFLAV